MHTYFYECVPYLRLVRNVEEGTGRLLQVLLEQASKDPIPGLGGVTGERYTASLIVVGYQADSGASQASADKVDSRVRRIALSWLDKMLFCGTSLQRFAASRLPTQHEQ